MKKNGKVIAFMNILINAEKFPFIIYSLNHTYDTSNFWDYNTKFIEINYLYKKYISLI